MEATWTPLKHISELQCRASTATAWGALSDDAFCVGDEPATALSERDSQEDIIPAVVSELVEGGSLKDKARLVVEDDPWDFHPRTLVDDMRIGGEGGGGGGGGGGQRPWTAGAWQPASVRQTKSDMEAARMHDRPTSAFMAVVAHRAGRVIGNDRSRTTAVWRRAAPSIAVLTSANLRSLARKGDPPFRNPLNFNETAMTRSFRAVSKDDTEREWVRRAGGAFVSDDTSSLETKTTMGLESFAMLGPSQPEDEEDGNGTELQGRGDKQGGAKRPLVKGRPVVPSASVVEPGGDPNNLDEQEFRRLIKRLHKNKVKLFGHLTCNKRSIKQTVDLLTDDGWSPTERYHRLVALGDKAPWPLTLKRSMCPTSIDISDQSLGDELGCLLAETLADYPILESLNVAGCQLTDTSLIPLLNAVMRLPRLETLNLSGNDIDESSDVLRKYLESPQCKLRTLGLCSDDVDDSECGLIMESMRQNKSVASLDLAKNLIGESGSDDLMSTRGGPMPSSEASVTQQDQLALKEERDGLLEPVPFLDAEGPGDATTMADCYATSAMASTTFLSFRLIGAKAVAETLRVNTTLIELDLSNNFLRDASASTLALALRSNAGLTRLDLSNNAFMDEPAQLLGDALRYNTTLKQLDLSFNNVSPKAAFVFASTLTFHNKTIRHLLLSGNMIGIRSLRAMYRAIRVSAEQGRRLIVEMMDCCDSEDGEPVGASLVLDIYDPQGQYKLDLTKPYDFAMANQLLHAANTNPGSNFARLASVTDDPFSNVKEQHIVLKKRVTRNNSTQYDTRMAAERLLRIHKQRGIIYPEELGAFMKRLGLNPSRDTAWRVVKLVPDSDLTEAKLLRAIFIGLFREVDLDGSGFIDLVEFRQAMKLLGLDLSEEVAKQHLVEYDIDRSGTIEEPEFILYMMERFSYKIMDFQKTILVTASGQPWVVPSTGVLNVDFHNEMLPATFNQMTTEAAVHQILENMQVSSRSEVDRMELFDSVILHSDIYLNSTQVLYLKNHLDIGLDAVGTVATIMPQIINYKAALEITEPFLTLRQRFLLHKLMGNAFRPIMGSYAGHYTINLENKWDRIAIRKLAELDNKARLESSVDMSQRGNRSAFRNETMDGNPFEIRSDWIVRSLPTRGVLRFDFSCTLRPQVDTPAITMRRFQQLMAKLQLSFYDADLMAATSTNVLAAKSLSSTGAALVGEAAAPATAVRESAQGADEDTVFKDVLYEDPLQGLNDVVGPFNSVLFNFREMKQTSRAATLQRAKRLHLDVPIYMVPLDEANPSPFFSPSMTNLTNTMSNDYIRNTHAMTAAVPAAYLPSTEKLTYVRAVIKLCELELAVTPLWLTCDQAVTMLRNFSSDDYIRIIALLVIFPKIIDMRDFHKVIALLEGTEREELVHRLGHLIVCDVEHPMVYNLDLSVYEDMMVCEMLVLVAVLHGPCMWTALRYKYNRLNDWEYDWSFPTAWVESICRAKRQLAKIRGGAGLIDPHHTLSLTAVSPSSERQPRPHGYMVVSVCGLGDPGSSPSSFIGGFGTGTAGGGTAGKRKTKQGKHGNDNFFKTVGLADFVVMDTIPLANLLPSPFDPRSSSSNTDPLHDSIGSSGRGSYESDHGGGIFEYGFESIAQERGGLKEQELLRVIHGYMLTSLTGEAALSLSGTLTNGLPKRQGQQQLTDVDSPSSTGGLFNVSLRFKTLRQAEGGGTLRRTQNRTQPLSGTGSLSKQPNSNTQQHLSSTMARSITTHLSSTMARSITQHLSATINRASQQQYPSGTSPQQGQQGQQQRRQSTFGSQQGQQGQQRRQSTFGSQQAQQGQQQRRQSTFGSQQGQQAQQRRQSAFLPTGNDMSAMEETGRLVSGHRGLR